MEQQKLPNVTIVIVLSIIGFVCCCFAGIPGILFGGIGLILALKDQKKYQENPEGYSNYSQLKTAKILAIIALAIGVMYLAYTIFSIAQMGGWEGYMEKVNEIMEQYQ
ncbi:CCC motif membrane protein [Maribacter sp. 2308TA10-17]|uniref:CCC motif membrane protein n=1 Tax=Maribacter sp. 2308TA10-17 TaxID=3386276 RepID=UPI0039BC56B5